MQWTRGRPDPPTPRGAEAWLPALVLAVTQIVLVIALVWFLVVARPLRARNELPRVVIPIAMATASLVALMMLWRAWRALRTVRNALRNR
jgi:hypothetical protein